MRTFTLFLLAVAAAPAAFADPIPQNGFVELSKKIIPSVVNISTFGKVETGTQGGNMGSPEDFFRWWFGDRQEGGPGPGMPPGHPPTSKGRRPNIRKQALGQGTGFVIDASGLILTNFHVVGEADEIQIIFTEDDKEKPTPGEVIGRDAELDVALIKVKTDRKLTAVALGNSSTLEVGEYVVAAGNPFGRGHSVVHGIISAKERTLPGAWAARYLQTDAPINPGNSGGPLVNLKGEVIGINNAIDPRAQGIGFAIPIDLVKDILPQLKSKGRVQRGYLGVGVAELSPEIAKQLNVAETFHAPMVTQVEPGKPAADAGLQPYDLITHVNGKRVETHYDLVQAVTAIPVGDKAHLKIMRKGKELEFDVKVALRPSAEAETPAPKKNEQKNSGPQTGLELGDLTSQIQKELGLSEKTKGAVVLSVEYGSPADEAGLTRGDVILEINRQTISSTRDFERIVRKKESYLLRVRSLGPENQEIFRVLVLNLKDTE